MKVRSASIIAAGKAYLGLSLKAFCICSSNVGRASIQEALVNLPNAKGVQPLGLQALVHDIRVAHIRYGLALHHPYIAFKAQWMKAPGPLGAFLSDGRRASISGGYRKLKAGLLAGKASKWARVGQQGDHQTMPWSLCQPQSGTCRS